MLAAGEPFSLVALYSVYAGPGVEPAELPAAETAIAVFAAEHGLQCIVTEFTASESRIWSALREIMTGLEDDYRSERRLYLYYSRLNEISVLASMTTRGRSARYGLVVRRAAREAGAAE
jgi:hypothetical protein